VEVLKSILKRQRSSGYSPGAAARAAGNTSAAVGDVHDIATAHWHGFMWVGIWTVCVFALIAVLDAAYQRFAFTKR